MLVTLNLKHISSCTVFDTQLEEEAARLDLLKKQNMEKVILASRDELEDWWNKCYYSREQKHAFEGFYEGKHVTGSMKAKKENLFCH